MWRFTWVGLIGVALLAQARPAHAQPPRGKDDVKALQAELAKLRNQISELETRLQKSAGDGRTPDRKGPEGAPFAKKGEGKGPGGKGPGGKGPGGGGPGGPPFARDGKKSFEPPFMRKGEDMRKGDDKGPAGGPPFARKGDFKGPGGPPFMRPGEGKGPAGGPPFARKDDFKKPGGAPGARMEDRKEAFARKSFGPPAGGPPWSRMSESRRPGEASSSLELERRVERILREVEDLQRLIRRR